MNIKVGGVGRGFGGGGILSNDELFSFHIGQKLVFCEFFSHQILKRKNNFFNRPISILSSNK
jgi:hypothetical protein